MKSPKLVLASIALFLSLAAFSQTDTTKSKKDTTTKKDTATVAIQEATTVAPVQEAQSVTAQQPTSTVPQSQPTTATATTPTTEPVSAAKETAPKPNFGRYYIPVLGSYQSSQSTAENKSVTITGDESNPGKVWVEGLAPTKFYALLKAVPGTYKIPAQKIDDNSVLEGTVLYDESSKQINICLGCGYQDTNPSEVLTSTTEETSTEPADKKATAKNKIKAKTTVVTFTGTKSEQGTASINQ